MPDNRRFALVGPNFFSYIQGIRNKMAERGMPSEFFDERHANSIPVKVLYRIGFYSLFSRRKRLHLDEIAASIVDGGFSDALLIDVEACDRPFVERLTRAGVRVHLYMWDSAKNKPAYLRYLDLLHGKSSFDSVDCEQHGLRYVPLFAEDVFSSRHQAATPIQDRPIDVAFCGTLHSNRAKRIGELMDFAKRHGLTVSLLLYFHSRGLLALKSLAHVSNARFLHCVSTRGYSKQEIYALFARSRFVFDLPHPGQCGLTARTFEVLRSGARLITFNEKALSLLPASLIDRVAVIRTVDDIAGLDFLGPCPSPLLSEDDDYFLSLDRFVDQLFDLMTCNERKIAPMGT